MNALQSTAYESAAKKPPVAVAASDRRAIVLRPIGLRPPQCGLYARAAKPLADRLAAVLFLVTLSPAIVMVSLAVVLLSGWPPWYRSRRVGLNGREFWMLKVRTMRRDADAVLARLLESSPKLRLEFTVRCKITDDPRITGIGRLLRKLSIDELPQLVNVALGHMSLVGPRPVPQDELEWMYGRNAAAVCSVRPGVTGLWQTSGRSSTTYAQRVAADLTYVETLTLLGDVKILLKTAGAVLLRQGAE
jgi:lipopolysaccharide/colanic/teichoic acid biosynthesis glycosyltransferase